MTTVFKREFLLRLQDKCGNDGIIDYYMDELNLSFHDAILTLADFYDMEPEYWEETDPLITDEEKKSILKKLKESLDENHPLNSHTVFNKLQRPEP